jgi:hypothetical protein
MSSSQSIDADREVKQAPADQRNSLERRSSCVGPRAAGATELRTSEQCGLQNTARKRLRVIRTVTPVCMQEHRPSSMRQDPSRTLFPGAVCARLSVDQGEPVWLGQTVDTKVDIEFRPVQVISMQQLNVQDLAHGCLAEPRKVLVGQEVFLVLDQNPLSELTDVGDFNPRSACATRRGFHLSSPPPHLSTPIPDARIGS